ncbi:Trypsin and PAN 1 domain containing protein [Trichuris trichiura]|uniref:Trypsin and PAN 1 domain containing protein n=1 Tax=Trichuris trichiura TaxID=36087 RepID=A0A077ZFL2_TRITR|nr:Trypsin and PAN 1 domain containing protein [Trichuris trichiura]
MGELKLQPDSLGVEIDHYKGGYKICEFREEGVNAKDELYLFRCSAEKFCCGRECCLHEPEVLPLWALILLLLLLLLFIVCILGAMVYLCKRRRSKDKLTTSKVTNREKSSYGNLERNGRAGETQALVNHAKPDFSSVIDFESSVGREPSSEPCSSDHTQVMQLTSNSTINDDTMDSRRHGLVVDKEGRQSERFATPTGCPIKESFERPPTPIAVTYHNDSELGQEQRPMVRHLKVEEKKAQLVYYTPSVGKFPLWPGLFPQTKATSPDITMTLAEKLLNCNSYEESGHFLKGANPVVTARNTQSLQSCLSLCWAMRTGFDCRSVNYNSRTKRCDILAYLPATLPLSQQEVVRQRYSSFAIPKHCSDPVHSTPAPPTIQPLPPIKSYSNCGTSWYRPFVNSPFLNRIIGGIDSRPHSLPWSVSVQSHRQHQCGGTLIQFDPNVMMTDLVLTAAHCVLEENDVLRPFHEMNVQIGAHRLSMYETGQQNVRVKRMIAHKSYNFSNPHSDIAIIQLEYPVQFSKTVQPICLPPEGQKAEVGEICLPPLIIADTHFNDHLMQVYVPFLDINECAKNDSYGQRVYKEIMLCAGYMDGGRDACQGDSGGPLVCKDGNYWVQKGVVSFGEGCGDKRKPGIYTNVGAFRSWVDETIAELSKTRSFAS